MYREFLLQLSEGRPPPRSTRSCLRSGLPRAGFWGGRIYFTTTPGDWFHEAESILITVGYRALEIDE